MQDIRSHRFESGSDDEDESLTIPKEPLQVYAFCFIFLPVYLYDTSYSMIPSSNTKMTLDDGAVLLALKFPPI